MRTGKRGADPPVRGRPPGRPASSGERPVLGDPRGPGVRRRGSALLAVLWLSAALAAIAFALSTTVRGETERASSAVDGLRAYYLASGAVQRAAVEVLWSIQYPNQRPLPQGTTAVDYNFPGGVAHVEIIPETAKLNVNLAPPEELYRLGIAIGLDPNRAQQVAKAIVAWRQPAGDAGESDGYYSSLDPSFRAPHASIQEIEELLLVKGVTPDIFYGTYIPAEEGSSGPEGARLIPREGLADCLSVYGARDRVDANTASPAVLAAVGLNPYAISALIERRRVKPLTMEDLPPFLAAIGAPMDRLRVEGNSILTIRATARPRLPDGQLSDLKRTVAAQVKYMPKGYDSLVHILRWNDAAWSN